MKLKRLENIKRIMREGVGMNDLKMKPTTASVKFDLVKEELMRDDEFKDEYNKLQPRYEIISQLIEARKSMKMTQEELAHLAGTTKSNISRLESGSYNPSLDFLIKIAASLGKKLQIKIH